MKKFLLFLLVSVMVFGCLITVSAKEETTIAVLEDAYVINANGEGDQSKNNFGADKEIHLKTNSTTLTRYGYLKFDISSLAGVTDFTCIDLELTLSMRQQDAGNPEFAVVEVYGTSNSWKESTITFSTQPESYLRITANENVSAKTGTVNAFSITDYVRQALQRGEKEISLYLVENTPGTHLHTRFHTKENGDAEKAPKLRVYYGTKTDIQVYGDAPLRNDYEYVPSVNGIDTFIGKQTSIRVVSVKSDTYVSGGETDIQGAADVAFGGSEIIDFKAKSGSSNSLYRIPLLKFDISAFVNPVNKVELFLNCISMQSNVPTLVDVFGCDPYSWEENVVTFMTRPAKGEYITTVDVTKTGIVSFDITSYVNEAIANGEKIISLMLDGDVTEPLRLKFDSKESQTGTAPYLKITEGELNFATKVLYEGENPWDVAADRVSTWLNRWEEIKAVGDYETEMVEKDVGEYTIIVDAANPGGNNTDGYNTKYTQRATRTLSTLKGFTADKSEVALYDVYGGLMDESLKQEATGYFYTKKIGDRWWTIDPLGYPFYRTACVLITSGSSTNQQQAVLAKEGSKEAWAVEATARLKTLGYNSTGGWSDIDRLSKVDQPLAQTMIFYALSAYTKEADVDLPSGGSTEMVGNMLPVFDPAFAVSADKTAKSKLSPYANKDYVYGWMSDNELPDESTMLDSVLAFDPNDERLVYSYATAWTFMFLKTGKEDVSVNDVTPELRKEFRAMVYDRYFEVMAYVVEKYAPTHQYMGCRFLMNCAKDEYVMRVAGRYCDIITLNYYGVWEGNPELMSNMERWSGKPFVVTEWYAKGMDVWEADNRMTNQSGAGFTVRTQKDRGLFYQNYALMLMECKNCVGFDWFQYWDNDPENLNADPSNRNANKGIYSNTYEEYTVLTKYMEELNNQKHHVISFFDAR